LRLGIPKNPFFDNLHPEIARAVDAAIAVVGKLTASSREIELPSPNLPMDQIYASVRSVEAYTYHAKWLAESPEKYQPSTRQRLVQNFAEIKTETYAQSLRQVQLLRKEIWKTFETVDILITPTLSLLPVKIANGTEPVGGSRYPLGIRNTAPFNVLGVPAITVPCGFTTSGLPIGLQIVAAPFAETTVLALAGAYENQTEWHLRRPPL